jgi:peptide/nickel transport system permease protein
MSAFVVSRLLRGIPVLLGVTLLVFLTLHFLPGDPATILMSGTPTSSLAMERIRSYFVLDRPLYEQYVVFLGRLLRGDLGWSLRMNRPVLELLLDSLGNTVQLTFAGLGIATALGMILGLLAALRPNSLLDNLSMLLAFLGVSVPEFWLGLVFLVVFSIQLGWLPITGEGGIKQLILPAFSLGLPAAAMIARLMRSSMLEVMGEEYILVATAKGLSKRMVLMNHAVKNALIPVVTIVGLQFGRLMGGAVIVETVFARQGVGRLVVSAILEKDIPLVQGIVVFAAFWYVVANTIVDLAYMILDPRIRVQ